MACSKEEIERKRLKALEKIRNRSELNTSNGSQQFSRSGQVSKEITFYNKSNNHKNKFQPYKRNVPSPTLKEEPVFGKIISGTVYLISENRFEVKPSGFNEALINIFKSIPSKMYDGDKRLWNFSVDHHDELKSKVSVLKPMVVLGFLPTYVLNALQDTPRETCHDLSQIENTLRDKLLPFQLDGVRFGIEKQGRCLIADDMGLGKTYQALAIADYYRRNWPLLIITTSSMRETWESCIHELLPSIPMATIVCVSSGKEKGFLLDKQTQVVIISYKMTTLCTEQLLQKKFGCVILDESHFLKSYKAQSTECVTRITRKSQRVILLSGTPALSRPSELYTQLYIIEPHYFNGFTEYGKRYCAGKQTNFGWDMTGQSNLVELQILLKKKFLIRRTKDQVLTRLKEKTREAVILDSSLLNSEMTKELSTQAVSYTSKKGADKHVALLAFFNETAKVKIPAICEYVSNTLAEENGKFLVFAHHRIMLEAICNTLDENGVHYICIDGSTRTDYRSVLVDKFQVNDSCRCAVLSITAACAGITLTAAQLVLFAELHWNPGILTQAESRAHRIGQNKGVQVKYLLAKGTSDDYIWPMLENKLQVLNEAGLSKDSFGGTTQSKQNLDSTVSSPTTNRISNYFHGTNIPSNSNLNGRKNGEMDVSSDVAETSFLDDFEGDEMLSNLQF